MYQTNKAATPIAATEIEILFVLPALALAMISGAIDNWSNSSKSLFLLLVHHDDTTPQMVDTQSLPVEPVEPVVEVEVDAEVVVGSAQYSSSAVAVAAVVVAAAAALVVVPATAVVVELVVDEPLPLLPEK